MASECTGADRGIVALYAGRLQGRAAIAPVQSRQSRPAPAVHHFGRQPAARRRFLPAQRRVTVSALVATVMMVGTQTASAATSHQVQPGETLGEIAQRYNLTVEKLAALNQILNPDVITTGTMLVVDDAAPGDTAPAPARTHRVLSGETLSEIAGRYGMTVESLVAANALTNPDLILAGADLAIPSVSPNATQPARTTPETAATALHFVVPGETLGAIADKYGVSVDALISLNAITDPNLIDAGQLLQVPGTTPRRQDDGTVMLRGMPILRQSLPLSCESAALSIATAYWGQQISEWVFIENMPYHPNPHHGFRGRMTGPFGGTTDYGVYSEPLVPLLNRYGFVGEAFYADGDASLLKQQIDMGRPVLVWMTNMASAQPKSYEWYEGERFALVPQQHAVVAYGYDQNQVFIADPGDGAYRTVSWDDFMRAWGYFDGMSLAVYPA